MTSRVPGRRRNNSSGGARIRPLKFIVGLTNWYENWDLVVRAAALADELGFWGVSVPDHYMRAGGEQQEEGTLDSWVALTHLAAKTKTIRVGTMVTPIPLRPPGLLAKMVASLDVVSNGRTFLGVGPAGRARSSKPTASGTKRACESLKRRRACG